MLKILICVLALASPVRAQDKPPLTVGVIYIGTANDYGYNRAMKDGVEALRKATGADVLEAENVPESAEAQRVMAAMIAKGAKLIMATSFGHQEFAFNLARSHPQVAFVYAGGWMLIGQGADIVPMHVDSPATVIQIAENRGVYSIGFQSIEARALAPKGWLTGLGFNWGPYMTETAQQVVNGTFKGKMVRLGLREKMLVVAPFGDAVPQNVRDAVDAAAARVADGFTPFTGPIKDNTGAYALRAGEKMENSDMGKFDWYAEGVIGRVK